MLRAILLVLQVSFEAAERNPLVAHVANALLHLVPEVAKLPLVLQTVLAYRVLLFNVWQNLTYKEVLSADLTRAREVHAVAYVLVIFAADHWNLAVWAFNDRKHATLVMWLEVINC